jgi:ABC-type Fe3+/spermidine/putrescine transport system ATPase subunit
MKNYLITIVSGISHEINTDNVFVTQDKEKAQKWVDRYNRIIDENTERIEQKWNDGELCHHSYFIYYERPAAYFTEIDFR